MKHPKTTVTGILTILGSICTLAASWLAHGTPPPEQFAAVSAAIAAGIGLITASDSKKE